VSRHLKIALAAALAVGLGSCSADTSSRYSREKAQKSLEKLESPGLVIGEFTLGAKPVTDGDTIRVDGLDSSLRLIGMDCEETFKKEEDRRDSENDFEAYLVDRRGSSKHPVKIASPLGEEAKAWAKEFFADVQTVRLERDHPRDIRDRYNRYLAYAIALKDGKWVNYNVEAVRAGMSPYFSKYGYSRRFHDEFVAAEQEAREHQRGIFDPAKEHARDYDERKLWWDARAEFVRAFDVEAEGRDDHVIITNWDAMRRLEKMVGKEVTVLGTVGDVRLGDRGPTKVYLSRRMFSDLPLIFFDKDVYGTSQIGRWKGEFVKVRGTVSMYRYKTSGKEEMQIVINTPGQITASEVPGLDPDSDPDAGEADE
jgi:endonuclease YncB( thermonuclease family)